jgi:hypothetical protein
VAKSLDKNLYFINKYASTWRLKMPSLTIKDIDPKQYQGLVDDARQNGRSLAAEMRALIAERGRKREVTNTVAKLREIRAQTAGMFGPHPDSVSLIRTIRDEE